MRNIAQGSVAETGLLRFRKGMEIAAFKDDRAGVGREETGKEIDEGGLAGAGTTDKGDEFAGEKGETGVIDGKEGGAIGGAAVEGLNEGGGGEDGRGRGHGSWWIDWI